MARRRRSPRRPRGLSGLSVADLHAELRRRERRVGTLSRRRHRLAATLAVLDSQIESMGGLNGRAPRGRRAASGSRQRPKNQMNLVQALRRLLGGRTMSVTEASGAVQRAGYRTASPNFRTIVNQTLINSGEFRRVARGKYTAK